MKFVFTLLFASVSLFLPAQDTLYVASTHSAYDSSTHQLLVQTTMDVLEGSDKVVVTRVDTFTYLDRPDTLRYDSSYLALSTSLDTVFIGFTPLPLIQITTAESINQYVKKPGHFTYGYGTDTLDAPMAFRHRGSFSLRYPKRSFDLEFRDPVDPEESTDATFLDLREDDDWVLDALYNEPSRVNAYVAHKVWLDLHTLAHQEEEPEAKAGADVAFVEVFLNSRYHGLFLLSEQVDRKQLKLKKYKDGIRGELFKSEDYTPATQFTGVPVAAPKDDDWAGWEVKHPEEDEVDWDHLRDLIRFVSESSDSLFLAEAGTRFDLENLADYLLFVNGLRLTDNISKNSYLGRYDSLTPYFYTPWDLDAGLGNGHDARRITDTDGWSQNGLFARLTALSPEGFNDRLCNRYNELRQDLLRPDSLQARVSTAMNYLRNSGAYQREEGRWPALLNYSDEQAAFTASFIEERIDFLDGYVCAISTSTAEPVAGAVRVLRTFPNPASRELYVADAAPLEGAPYALFSADGRRVVGGSLPSDGHITLPALPTGMYFLRVGRLVSRVAIVP